MSEEKQISQVADHVRPDWVAIANGAEVKVRQAIEQLSDLLTTKNRFDLLGRVATYILLPPGGTTSAEEHAQQSEVNLEYLCSIATALPISFSLTPPSADDVQNTIDLLATICLHSSVYYTTCNKSSKQEGEELSEMSISFQMQKLHVRGDGYCHHLKQTWHDILTPHAEMFQESTGFDFVDYIKLVERLERVIEDRVNQESDLKVAPYREIFRPWRNELKSDNGLSDEFRKFLNDQSDQIEFAKRSFDEFGSPESFLVDAESNAEKRILAAHSCSFGDNEKFSGENVQFRFWPLNETLTDRNPFIRHQDKYYAFNLAKIGRNTYDFLSNALRDTNPKYWQTNFLPARDRYLEEETARLFQKALPEARVITSAFYPIKTGGKAEADIVVTIGDVLLVVECKAGAITPVAKRGEQMRVKSDVEKTVAKGLNQAKRLVAELADRGEMTIKGKNSQKIILKSEDFQWAFRVNVTLDLVNSVASNIWSLSDIGLMDSTERCWSVSLNDLRVIVDILDRSAVFLHYLIRRCDTNLLRTIEASDELDYMMYYVIQGLFFRGRNTPKENEHVQIGTYTDDLDRYYRRVQGLTDRGSKPRIALGTHTERFLDLLEKWQPKGWMTASLQFMEFDRPDREELLGKIHWQFKRIRERRSQFGFSVIGCSETKTAIALVCAQNPEVSKDVVRAKCISRCKDYGFDSMVVILVGMPVSAKAPIILCVTPNDSAPDHAKRLLAMLRFDVTEHQSKESKPGIFDGIRQDED